MSEGGAVCSSCRFGDLAFPCRIDGNLDMRRLASLYLEHFRARYGERPSEERAEELFWAYDCLSNLCLNAPDDALDIVLLALTLVRNDDELSYLAAGPMEDLVVHSGEAVIDRIECEAKESAEFRRLLSGIWSQFTEHTEVWRRVQEAVRPGPWMDEDPRTPQGSARYWRRGKG